MSKLIILSLFALVSSSWGYSGGAPESTCEDMTPKHPVDPQPGELPYKINLSKDNVSPRGEVNITISGGIFKGYLLQVRNKAGKSVGRFKIPSDDRYSKAINCHGSKDSAATHKNSYKKDDFTITWIAPATTGKYTVYATIAKDGGTFWVQKPTQVIVVE